jgi:hypothetical protein
MALRLKRLLLAPCPSHYAGHLATMPSADFCLITHKVTPAGAIGFHLVRSSWVMSSKKPRYFYTRTLLVMDRSRVKQISPLLMNIKGNMNFPCTAASFTVAVRSHGFVVFYPKHFVGQVLPQGALMKVREQEDRKSKGCFVMKQIE